MRAFLYFFSIFLNVVVLCTAQDEDIESAFNVCFKEFGLPDKIMDGPPSFDDDNVKCFLACVMKRIGNMVNGKISLEREIEYFAKYVPDADEELLAKMKQCVAVANQQSDECEVCATMAKCMMGSD